MQPARAEGVRWRHPSHSFFTGVEARINPAASRIYCSPAIPSKVILPVMRQTEDTGRRSGEPLLRAHVIYVDVDAGVNVVEHVPAIMVRIFVDDKIIAAIPAPVRADGPVPGCDFKEEATGQPEAVAVTIESFDAVAVRGAKVFETAVFERMVDVKAPIVGPV